jgi:hypothetical protein
LVVEFNSEYDRNNSKEYVTIETKSNTFLETYKLVYYNPKSEKGNTSVFLFNKIDSAGTAYNYFRNINEALLFLGENGWELVSVNNDISSDGATRARLIDSEVPYTKIKSIPVFYFKKPVDQ